MTLYARASDGSIVDIFSRTTIFFSFTRFKEKICKQGHCFICGAAPSSHFNNEHIFPRWILKASNLFHKTLALPNGNKVKYGTYKIPCCTACNSKLGILFEEPISEAFSRGFNGVTEYIKNGGTGHLCAWLSLIFAKVHLRDFHNPQSLDDRKNTGAIADQYDLGPLHHVHAVARAASVGLDISEDVLGTLVLIHIDDKADSPTFDYCDNLDGTTLLLRFRDIALIYVLDDCGGTSAMLSAQMERLPYPISELQVREVYARYLTANAHLRGRPTFYTEVNTELASAKIKASIPELDFHEFRPDVFGNFFVGAAGAYLETLRIDGLTREDAMEKLREGNFTLLDT